MTDDPKKLVNYFVKVKKEDTNQFIELGRGAYKVVYKAIDRRKGLEVAWNELDLSKEEIDIEKINQEVKILASLDNDHVIKFFESWVDVDGMKLIFITELMTSGSLRSFIQQAQRVSIRVVKDWCRQILSGLKYLHCLDPPIIHRDIKLDNIFFLGTLGKVKIGDLGLATVLNRHLKIPQSVIGTPEFMAPEFYEEKYDEKVDIWAFGLCVIEMVTLEYPFRECTNVASVFRTVSSGLKPLALAKIDNPTIIEFVASCLEMEPEKRLSAAELLVHDFLAKNEEGDLSYVTLRDKNLPEVLQIIGTPQTRAGWENWLNSITTPIRAEKERRKMEKTKNGTENIVIYPPIEDTRKKVNEVMAPPPIEDTRKKVEEEDELDYDQVIDSAPNDQPRRPQTIDTLTVNSLRISSSPCIPSPRGSTRISTDSVIQTSFEESLSSPNIGTSVNPPLTTLHEAKEPQPISDLPTDNEYQEDEITRRKNSSGSTIVVGRAPVTDNKSSSSRRGSRNGKLQTEPELLAPSQFNSQVISQQPHTHPLPPNQGHAQWQAFVNKNFDQFIYNTLPLSDTNPFKNPQTSAPSSFTNPTINFHPPTNSHTIIAPVSIVNPTPLVNPSTINSLSGGNPFLEANLTNSINKSPRPGLINEG